MCAELKMYSIMLIFLFPVLLVTSPAFISGSILKLEPAHGSTGRSLLQIIRACSEDLESKNYTIITSQCKGPSYSKEACCGALKSFACPFADLINDERTNCATTMFSYINLIGNYPPGLFANMCREDKLGLACLDNSTKHPAPQKSSGLASVSIHYPRTTLVVEFFVLFLILHCI